MAAAAMVAAAMDMVLSATDFSGMVSRISITTARTMMAITTAIMTDIMMAMATILQCTAIGTVTTSAGMPDIGRRGTGTTPAVSAATSRRLRICRAFGACDAV
jgi:hypothetical protein